PLPRTLHDALPIFDTAKRQLTGVTENPGTTSARTTSFAYDATSKLLNRVTDARNNPTQLTFDAFNRLKTLVDRRNSTWTYNYTSAPGQGAQTTTITAPGTNAVTTYNISARAPISGSDQRIAGGNVTSIKDAGNDSVPGGVTSTYQWTQNRLTQTKDGANDQKNLEYNDLGLLTKVTEPSPNDPNRTDLPSN